jgi:hypothetical protein
MDTCRKDHAHGIFSYNNFLLQVPSQSCETTYSSRSALIHSWRWSPHYVHLLKPHPLNLPLLQHCFIRVQASSTWIFGEQTVWQLQQWEKRGYKLFSFPLLNTPFQGLVTLWLIWTYLSWLSHWLSWEAAIYLVIESLGSNLLFVSLSSLLSFLFLSVVLCWVWPFQIKIST